MLSFVSDLFTTLAGNGLRASFFDGNDFGDLAIESTVDDVNLSSSSVTKPADDIVSATEFSVRFEGFLKAQYDQEYTIYLTVSEMTDRVRLSLSDKTIIDGWSAGSAGAATLSSTFTFGNGTGGSGLFEKLLLEYSTADSAGNAGSSWGYALEWESSGGVVVAREVIPSSSLFSASPIAGSPFSSLIHAGKKGHRKYNVLVLLLSLGRVFILCTSS